MLDGMRVIDLTSVVFGPYATQILADLGAEVIKIEPPAGDMFRIAGKPVATPGMGACHMTINRGKRSVMLDLKLAADAAVLRDLIATADVFIHNIRAKAIARLGFDYASVAALKPDIVYVHCVGFGSDGPYGDLQAYDDVIQAATGATTLMSRVDGDPTPRYLPSLIADKVAGLHGAQGVLAALIHRLRTGEGQFVEVPMFESFAHFMLVEHLYGATFEPQTYPAGYPRQIDPLRQPFPTADGHISIVPYVDAAIVTLLEMFDDPALLADPRFATPRERARNIGAIYAAIARHTPSRTSAEWMERLTAAQIPAMPVRDLDAMLSDPHFAATGFFKRRDHPTEGGYREMQPPIRYGAMRRRDLGMPQSIGQDTAAVIAALERVKRIEPPA